MRLSRIPSLLVIFLIDIYRLFISPWKGPCCRFTPTCSAYGREAIARFGCVKGGWLTLCRVVKCQPFYHGCVIDPVPEKIPEESSGTASEDKK